MWWKLLLLTFYLTVLFVLSRILEAVAYYDSGYLAARLLDPVALSVKKLKILLDQRGVSYAGVVEKQELTDLVDASGEVNEGELEVATHTEEVSTSTNFTCGTHFYEEVEDTKDSVWVVQVVRDSSHPFMALDDWRSFIKRLGRFSVRTGIFDCSLDFKLCDRKNWFTSRLVLSVPVGNKPKDSVVLRSYTGSTRVQAAFDWVNFNLASRIRQIYDLQELQKDWFSWEETRQPTKVRVILFSTMKIPPMFYSVMSVKFSGRVRFGTVNVNSREGKNILNRLRLTRLPTYLILTPEGNATYGEREGEYLNYRSMCVLLKTLHPEVNDMFLLSVIIVNITCWFDLFMASGVLLKRVGHLLWGIFKWNCFLILLWLPVLALFQLPYMGLVLDWMLKVLRLVSATPLAAVVRADWLAYSSFHCCLLVSTFFMFAALSGYVRRLYKGGADEDISSVPPGHHHSSSYLHTYNNNSTHSSSLGGVTSQNYWWNFSWDGYVNYLFRPMATMTRPMNPHPDELDLEVGMELLIERLAVPNFWLTPIISSDYIKELPMWRYNGHCESSSDICSDGETSCRSFGGESDCDGDDALNTSSAGGESSSSQRLPYLFTCEKCRALQREKSQIKSRHGSNTSLRSSGSGSASGGEEDNNGENTDSDNEDQLDSESACAKFLMDGDYKCLCKMSPKSTRSSSSSTSSRSRRHHSSSPIKQRARSQSPGSYAGSDIDDYHHHQPQTTTSHPQSNHQSPLKQRSASSTTSDTTLETTSNQMPQGILHSTECVICLEGYKFGVLLCGLPCGHCFHHQCILGWLSRDNHCCPVCRWPTYKAKPCSMHLHAE